MEFNKEKDELRNLEILKNEIKKMKSPYSKILIEALFSSSNSDEFRVLIKDKVSQYIVSKTEK
jgi:hypothetical protein